MASESSGAFFRYIGAKKVLGKLAETYPSPREKEEVPLWMYVASNLSMRLHGVHSFHAYPYVIRNRFALFTPAEHTELLPTLSADAGTKILEKIRRLRRDLEQELKLVRAP